MNGGLRARLRRYMVKSLGQAGGGSLPQERNSRYQTVDLDKGL